VWEGEGGELSVSGRRNVCLGRGRGGGEKKKKGPASLGERLLWRKKSAAFALERNNKQLGKYMMRQGGKLGRAKSAAEKRHKKSKGLLKEKRTSRPLEAIQSQKVSNSQDGQVRGLNNDIADSIVQFPRGVGGGSEGKLRSPGGVVPGKGGLSP